MPVDETKVREWVITHQHNMVICRYRDVPEGQPLVDFFAAYLYPPVEGRRAYEERNEFFRRLANVYKRGKLRQSLGPAVVFYAPIIWLLERMKELPEYLDRVVALYDKTNELDGRVARFLAERLESEAGLTKEAYMVAMRETSTLEERRAQVEEVVEMGGYAVTLVERGGIVDVLINHAPKIPFFSGNVNVRGLNETIIMVQSGFRAFKSRKDMLRQLKELCHQREHESVECIFAGKTESPTA